jgi:hypothetical protein
MYAKSFHLALVVTAVILACSASAFAATATFDILSPDADGEVLVLAGDPVSYEIFVTVTSDEAAALDNSGLAFFSITVATDLGITQNPAEEFDPTVAQQFPTVQSLGTPVDDDITQIGGGQNTFGGTIQYGVALNQQTFLARGTLLTPTQTLGTFTVTIGANTTANVFLPGDVPTAQSANVVAGQGFTIRTTDQLPDDGTDGGDGGDGMNGDGSGDGSGDGGDGTNGDGGNGGTGGTPSATIPFTTGMTLLAAMVAAIAGAFFLAGPLGALIMLILGPIAALILIFSGSV